MKHPDVWLAPGLAFLLAAMGMATLPIAIHHEAPHNQTDLMLTALPYVVGGLIGIVLWLLVERTHFDPAKAPPLFWLVATVAAMMLSQAWPTDYGRHQYPFEVDPILVGLPFFATFITGLSKRMDHDAPPMAWLCVLGGAGLMNLATWMGAILIPSIHVLLFPTLLLLAQNATLRRIGMVSVAGAILVLALILIDRPFMFFRILNAMTPSMTMWQDPLGVGYQSVHIWQVLHNLSWFGSNLEIHLPEATRQLLPVVVANRFGGLALAGLFGVIAFWFYLTRPTKQAGTPLNRMGDMVWWTLLYFAILNMGGNLLVIGLFGPGMPMYGSNPALLALALLVAAIRAQHRPAEAKP